MNCKKRKIAGYILSGLVTLIFVATGAMKFTGGEQNVQMAELVGGQTTLFILGGLQLLFALLFWIPRTAVVGFLLMACYMAGAMATHFGYQGILCPTNGYRNAYLDYWFGTFS